MEGAVEHCLFEVVIIPEGPVVAALDHFVAQWQLNKTSRRATQYVVGLILLLIVEAEAVFSAWRQVLKVTAHNPCVVSQDQHQRPCVVWPRVLHGDRGASTTHEAHERQLFHSQVADDPLLFLHVGAAAVFQDLDKQISHGGLAQYAHHKTIGRQLLS